MDKGKTKKWPVIGHDVIINSLQSAIANKKVNHAYLFSGVRSLGKMEVALNFAKELQGQDDDSNSPDFQILSGEEKIKIKDIRKIQHQMSLKSHSNEYKICIIDRADSMTLEAANSLLKLLEEPKGNVVFILLAENIDKVIPTIVSRCIVYNFYLVPEDMIRKGLSEKYDGGSIDKIIKLAYGRPGLAIKYLESDDLLNERFDMDKEIAGIIGENFASSFNKVAKWNADENDINNRNKIILEWFRDLMLCKIGCQELVLGEHNKEMYGKLLSNYSLDQISEVLNYVINIDDLLNKNVNRKLVFENLAILIKQ